MTNEFKAGDKVRRIKVNHYSGRLPIGSEWIVEHLINSISMRLEGFNEDVDIDKFEKVVNHEEEAIKVLTALGYGLTPPKPKLSGKVYVYRSTDGREQLSATTKSGYDSYYWELISIVDWTEGQGLESSTEATEPDGSF